MTNLRKKICMWYALVYSRWGTISLKEVCSSGASDYRPMALHP